MGKPRLKLVEYTSVAIGFAAFSALFVKNSYENLIIVALIWISLALIITIFNYYLNVNAYINKMDNMLSKSRTKFNAINEKHKNLAKQYEEKVRDNHNLDVRNKLLEKQVTEHTMFQQYLIKQMIESKTKGVVVNEYIQNNQDY